MRLTGFMVARFFSVLALASVLKASGGEPIPQASLFAAPKATLRTVCAKVDGGEVRAEGAVTAARGSAEAELGKAEDFAVSTATTTSVVRESSVQAFEAMNGGSVLSAREPMTEPGGAAGWISEKVWDPVFAPEVVTFGKVKMTGGIVAAVKRRNPFCLLHPLVFSAAW